MRGGSYPCLGDAMNRPDTLVCLSGGLDSIVLVECMRAAGRYGGAVHFVYAHPAQSHERRAVIAVRRRLHLAGEVAPIFDVDLPLRARQLASGVGAAGARVVPARNLSMLATAANLAASMGLSRVAIGATVADSGGYEDCRAPYLRAVSDLTEPFGVEVVAPLASMSRERVRAAAVWFGVPPGEPWSCYQPDAGRPCGQCDSCRQ